MPTVKTFEELEIWKMSRHQINMIYADLKQCRDYCIKDQLIRAGISIMSNIAEGFYRNSDAEFKNFLNISKGSAGEVKSLYYLAEDQKILPVDLAIERRSDTQRIINSIGTLMTYLKK